MAPQYKKNANSSKESNTSMESIGELRKIAQTMPQKKCPFVRLKRDLHPSVVSIASRKRKRAAFQSLTKMTASQAASESSSASTVNDLTKMFKKRILR